ncbi:MAG: hypothetical protein ACK5O7_02675 [Holosporales bacterium]
MLYKILLSCFEDLVVNEKKVAFYVQTPRDAVSPYVEVHILEAIEGTFAESSLVKAKLRAVSRYTGDQEIETLVQQLRQKLEGNSFISERAVACAKIQCCTRKVLNDGVTRTADLEVHFMLRKVAN